MAKQTGASLLPEDAQGGFQVPDGDYTIKEIQTDLFTYNGNVPEGVPAIIILYIDDDGNEYEQPYKAGDNAHLVASEDKTRFINPNDENAPCALYKGGAAFQWLSSILKAGFPKAQVGSDVTVFRGAKVSLVSVAAPTGKTKDEKKEGKTIPIVAKYLGMAKAGKGASRPTGRTSTAPARSTKQETATASDNGELDSEAIMKVQEALTNAKDNTLNRVKLQLTVWQLATKAKDANATEYRKLAGNVEWLTENAELGGWEVDGDNVSLPS